DVPVTVLAVDQRGPVRHARAASLGGEQEGVDLVPPHVPVMPVGLDVPAYVVASPALGRVGGRIPVGHGDQPIAPPVPPRRSATARPAGRPSGCRRRPGPPGCPAVPGCPPSHRPAPGPSRG